MFNTHSLGKLTISYIDRFAGVAEESGLFLSLAEEFLRGIFDTRVQLTQVVKSPEGLDMDFAESCHAKL